MEELVCWLARYVSTLSLFSFSLSLSGTRWFPGWKLRRQKGGGDSRKGVAVVVVVGFDALVTI